MRRFWRCPLSAVRLVSLAVLLAGCNGSASLPRLVPVEGKVMLAGKPVQEGVVTFVPADESIPGPWPEGAIGAGGVYTLQTRGQPGAPPGRYRPIFQPGDQDKSLAATVDPRYCHPKQTPLQVEVGDDRPRGAYDLELKTRTKR